MSASSRPRLLALLGLWLALVAPILAADVSVKATLSHRSTEVGEPVQLQVEIEGGSGRVQAPEVSIDGFEIRYLGPSTSRQMQMNGLQFTQHVTTTHVYQLTPKRAGEFNIPAILVDVNGQIYRTQPIPLKVVKGGDGGGAGDEDKPAVAELNISKRTAYVGEVLPTELILYIDPSTRAQLEQMPEIAGEGFIKQKIPEPHEQEAHRNGREWKAVAFRTAITPGKAGKITVGPCEIPLVVQVQRRQPQRRSRDPFDSFFNDPFFGGGLSQPQQLKITAPAIELDVKPLPAEGRPADFSGAVGQFKFTAEGSPNRVKLGDPVTMKMKITGTGNFDRMQAPALVDPTGWHTYPASDHFEAGDDLKTTGTKTFDMAVVPEAVHKQMPQFRFTYFDPQQGKYITETSAPLPLIVEGTPPPPPALKPPPVAGENPTAKATPRPAAAPAAPSDILGLRYERGLAASFTPLYTQRGFLLVQLLPLGLAAALLGARFLHKDSHTVRVNNLRRARERLWQKLRAESDTAEFYDLAAHVVQYDTALATDLEPANVDAATARASRPLDADTAAAIDEIFSARAELLYAGGSAPARTTLATADRQRVFTMLERFAKAHA